MLEVQVIVSLDSVSHQLYGNNNHHLQVSIAGEMYMYER